MITAEMNGIKMRLQAICTWSNPCDVSIFQEWDHLQKGKWIEEIQLTSEQAEQLIEEMKLAIFLARKIDREYSKGMYK